MKIIKIESCYACPNVSIVNDYCYAADKNLHGNRLPQSWCPLEDAPEPSEEAKAPCICDRLALLDRPCVYCRELQVIKEVGNDRD